MGKQPFISHVVNGYSRYDVPESKAFTCTPGILYPVRIDFINARDRVSIEQGIDVRSNPLAVPTFNPYTIRLHRFWVPLQLYHPELRTNSSKFDMNDLSLNWINAVPGVPSSGATPAVTATFSNSLMYWLRVSNRAVDFTTHASTSGVAFLRILLVVFGLMLIRILLIGISFEISMVIRSGDFTPLLGRPLGFIP